jgi:hypothetical protein
MKVVRLNRGYRISVNDSEYEALQLMLVVGGAASYNEQYQRNLSKSAKVAIRKEPFIDPNKVLDVTDDRRG